MGQKGGGNTPPDKELRNLAIPLPELRKPVQSAIKEANQQFKAGENDPWQFGPSSVLPWNEAQTNANSWGTQQAYNTNALLNPSAGTVSRVGGGQFIGNSPGQGTLEQYAGGGFVGGAPGQAQLNSLAQGDYVGRAPGQNALNMLADGSYVGKLPGQDLLNRFGAGEFMSNTPGQETLNNLARGDFVGKAPGQELLNAAGNARFVGNTPGQDTLSRIGAGQFARPGVPAYDELLNRSLGGSGGLGMIQGTAGGQFLQGNPHLDALIKSQSRDITQGYGDATAMTEGRVSGAGRLGSNAEYELQKRNADSLGQQLGDLETRTRYADYGNERAMQQQAQLALPGAFQTEINTGLGAANARAGDEWQALQTMLSGAGQAGQLYQNSLGQALGAATNAGNAYRSDLGLQGQFATGAGSMFQNAAGQALSGAQAAGNAYARDQATQMNAAQAAGQGFRADQATQANAAQAAGQGYRADQGLQLNAAGQAGQGFRDSLGQSLAAAGMAPGQAAAQFMGPDAAARYGGAAQQQGERMAQEAQARQRYEQEQEWQNLQRYLQSLQGAGGLTNPQAGGLGLQSQQGGGGSMVGDISSLAGSAAMLGSVFYPPAAAVGVPLSMYGASQQGRGA